LRQAAAKQAACCRSDTDSIEEAAGSIEEMAARECADIYVPPTALADRLSSGGLSSIRAGRRKPRIRRGLRGLQPKSIPQLHRSIHRIGR
jgi:hypothetical protein